MARVVVMGVAGCGKSTVGRALAGALAVPFVDGDDLHTATNIEKMAAGIPLTDQDRWPWLDDVGHWLADHPGGGVVACSALKRAYRDAIRRAAPDAAFVHLTAPRDVLAARVDARSAVDAHFMGSRMLDSQFADLEPLEGDEVGTEVRVDGVDADGAARSAARWLGAARA